MQALKIFSHTFMYTYAETKLSFKHNAFIKIDSYEHINVRLYQFV